MFFVTTTGPCPAFACFKKNQGGHGAAFLPMMVRVSRSPTSLTVLPQVSRRIPGRASGRYVLIESQLVIKTISLGFTSLLLKKSFILLLSSKLRKVLNTRLSFTVPFESTTVTNMYGTCKKKEPLTLQSCLS